MRETVEKFNRLEQELEQERAAALGRIGRRLEELIGRLHILQQRLADAADDERSGLVQEYAELHEQTRRYRWFLEVQREAVGLRRHDRLDEMYPIPPRSGR